MAGFTLVMGSGPVVISGIIQGFGLGFIFVPLQSLAFASLPPSSRTTGAALLNLARNIGGSVGISMVTTLLARNLQTSHSDLAAHITPYSIQVAMRGLLDEAGSMTGAAARMMDAEIQRQALMIAYLDDFHLMMLITFASMPLVWILRPARPAPGAQPVMAD